MSLILALFFVPSFSHALDFSSANKGSTAASFLKLGVGARGEAMGEAFSALTDEADALYWNPAALTRVERRSFILTHAPYLDGSYAEYVGAAQNLGPLGALGAGFQYYSASKINIVDENGDTFGSFTPHDMAFSLGYAYRFGRFFSFGAAIKYIQSKLFSSANTKTADFGLLSGPLWQDKLRLALVATNVGGSLKYEQVAVGLPLLFKLGASYRLTPSWIATLEGGAPIDDHPFVAIGTEYSLAVSKEVRFSGRAGFNSRNLAELGGVRAVYFGLGAAFSSLAADYAMNPMGGIGISHRVSLTWHWSALIPPRPEPAQNNPQERLDVAQRLIDRKSYAEADEELASGLRLLADEDPKRLLFYELRGAIALQRKDAAKAEGYYAQALNLAVSLGIRDAGVANLYAGLGLSFLAERDVAQAVDNFKKALEVGPSAKTRIIIEAKLKELHAQ